MNKKLTKLLVVGAICSASFFTTSLLSTTAFAEETNTSDTDDIEISDALLEAVEKGEISNYSPEELQLLEALQKQIEAYTADTEILESKSVVGDTKDMQTRAKIGSWSWRDGVMCLTDGGKSMVFFNSWHAAIVMPQNNYTVAEAINPERGVVKTISTPNTNNFSSRYTKFTVWQVGVKTTTVNQDYQAGHWAGAQVGKPYNGEILGDIRRKDKFYCSQLVWAAYYYTCGYDLDLPENNTHPIIGVSTWRIHPKEILDHSGTVIIYRSK